MDTDKNNKKSFLFVILIIAGILALTASAVLFIGRIAERKRIENSFTDIVIQLEEMLPELTQGSREELGNYAMPAVEIDGNDFAGLLEVKSYGIKLPVFAVWNEGNTAKCPAVYTGSAYNGSLVIGGRNTEKQFAFAGRLEGGEAISFTDVLGRVFSYTVEAVKHSEKISSDVLVSNEYALTLFVKLGSGYLIVRCN